MKITAFLLAAFLFAAALAFSQQAPLSDEQLIQIEQQGNQTAMEGQLQACQARSIRMEREIAALKKELAKRDGGSK